MTGLPDRPDFPDIELSRTLTIRDYLAAKNELPPNRELIAEGIRLRFMDRYLEPAQARPNGFTMMAVSCLMIEALESYVQGWRTTKGRSEKSFRQFFARVSAFTDFQDYASEFYQHVRCGILHQAETTAGWRIRRDGPLFNRVALTINARAFIEALRAELERFCDELEAADWNSEL